MDRQRPVDGQTHSERRPHHIASIAHHFLAPEDTDTGTTESRLPRWVVAAPGESQTAAFGSAGLAVALADLDHELAVQAAVQPRTDAGGVLLHESSESSWSARAYLQSRQIEPSTIDSLSELYFPLGWGPARSVAVRAESSGAPATESLTAPVGVHHLGQIDARYLDWIEMQPAVSAGHAPVYLVWCLRDGEIESLSAAHSLGRLCAAITPLRMECLVFPEHWPRVGPSNWKARVRRLAGRTIESDTPDLARLHERISVVAPDVPVRVTRLKAGEEGSVGHGASAAFSQIVRDLESAEPLA